MTFNLPRLATQMRVQRLRVAVSAGADLGKAALASGERITVGSAEGNDLVLADPAVSRYHLELEARDDGILVVDCGSTNGTWLGGARVERAIVPAGSELVIGQSRLAVQASEPALEPLHPEDAFGELRGQSRVMRRLMARLAKLAESDVPVLVVGESGTGKELSARALHDHGRRAAGPFVTVDCGSLSPALVASELFGHEKGSFTGADRAHAGAFERADGGTLLLDEVGELPADLQAHLLGVLERRRLRRVGGSEELEVDVRVVSATNRDLRAEVNAGRFRLDLYYRLAVVTLEVPPLRERAGDLAMLVEHFLRELGREARIGEVFAPAVVDRLEKHRWPGNVRELRNVVEAALATGEAPALRSDRPDPARRPSSLRPGAPLSVDLDRPYKDARADLLARFEARYLERLMQRAEGNVSRAAREASMTRSHLFELLRKNGLK